MKRIFLFIFLLFAIFAQSQTVQTTFGGYANIQSVSGVGPTFTLNLTGFQGNFRFEPDAQFLGTDVMVGDVVWLNCARYVITSVISSSGAGMNIVVEVPAADWAIGVSAPLNGQRLAVLREIDGLPSLPQSGDGNSGSISGVPTDLYNCIMNHYINRLTGFSNSVNEIAFTTGGTAPANSVATSLGYKLAKNNSGDGDLYEWNGSAWILNQRTGGSGGGSVSVKYDNTRLPATFRRIPARGVGANESVTNYNFSSLDDHQYYFSTTAYGTGSTDFGGWLANGTSGDSVCVLAPYWVLIGDSQAEGHPGRHGRLHPTTNTFDPFYADLSGQLSFTLATITKMRWFNHGIGGETSAQVWARWRRDVLAESYNPGDGRGARTLRANTKPMGVVVIAGINDFYAGSLNNVWHVSANLELMARSARDNGIQCVFLNCPGDEVNTAVQNRKIDSLNNWMASGILQSYGASVVDYNKWWRDPAYDDNMHGNSLIADDIHPTQVGYDSLAAFINRSARLPRIDSIFIFSKVAPTGGITGYSRPTQVTVQGRSYTFSGDAAIIPMLNSRLTWDSVWVKIEASTNISGTSTSGFGHLVWQVKNDTVGLVGRRNERYENYNSAATQVWSRASGVLSPTTPTDKVAIGSTTATTDLFVKGTTTDATPSVRFENSAGSATLVAQNNGNVAVGANTTPYKFGVYGSMVAQIAANNYWFFNGSTSEVYGSPFFKFQSTAINNGGNGFAQAELVWDGANFVFRPAAGTSGADNFVFSWRNKAGSDMFKINTANGRVAFGAITPQVSIDATGRTDGFWPPKGTTAQGVSGTGWSGVFRYDTDRNAFTGMENMTTSENFVLTPTFTPTTNHVLRWNGTDWVGSAETASTNIYNANGTLTGNRTLTHGANTLTYDASGVASIAQELRLPLNVKWRITDPTGATEMLALYHTSTTTTSETANKQNWIVGKNLVALQAKDYATKSAQFYLDDDSYVIFPDFASQSWTGDNKFGWHNTLRRYQYVSNGNTKTVANLEDDLIGTYTLQTANYTVLPENKMSEYDANAGNINVTIGAIEEGVIYKARCRRNGTNTITFTADTGYALAIDGDSTPAGDPDIVTGGAGSGIQAPFKIYTFWRYGSLIYFED